jgi:hypothetical protein
MKPAGRTWQIYAVGTEPEIRKKDALITADDGVFQMRAYTVSHHVVGFTKVQYLTGKAAVQACRKDGVVGGGALCYDYYVRESPYRLLYNQIAATPKIHDYNYETLGRRTLTSNQWSSAINSGATQTRYWQAEVRGGVFTSIEPIFVP